MRAGDQKPVYRLEWPKTDYPTHNLAHDPQHAGGVSHEPLYLAVSGL